MNPKVDPAALLLAVLAVGTTTLTGPGAWSHLATVSAAVVGVVVVTYTWPPRQRKHRNVPEQRVGQRAVAPEEPGQVQPDQQLDQRIEQPVDPSQSANFNYRAIIAQSTVYGFIFAIGIAWPWQQLLKSTDRATSWALISGLLLAIGAFICLSTLTNKHIFRWLNRSCKHIFGWLNRRGANRRMTRLPASHQIGEGGAERMQVPHETLRTGILRRSPRHDS